MRGLWLKITGCAILIPAIVLAYYAFHSENAPQIMDTKEIGQINEDTIENLMLQSKPEESNITAGVRPSNHEQARKAKDAKLRRLSERLQTDYFVAHFI